MATIAEIRKNARKHFTPEMEKRGFSLAKKALLYSRKVNDIYQVVVLTFSRGNEKASVKAFAWVPELAPQPYDWEKFPDGVTAVTGGELSDSGPVQNASHRVWPMLTEFERVSGLAQALEVIDRAAIPWFERISSRAEMVRYIRRDSMTDRFGNTTADKIMGKKILLKAEMPPPIGTTSGI